MVSGFISRLVILIFGTLYPAYASYKAVRTKNVKEYVKWMMYWIVFALFTCAETFTDLFLGFWFPFYYEIKIITVIYLLSPATKGSSILYRKFVHPVLIKREQEIDEYITKMKEQGYHTMLNLGTKGVNYATSLIMQTAIKGGGGLVNQLKKSYSLNDLTGEQNLSKTDGVDSSEVRDGSYVEDPRLIRRPVAHSPRLSAPSAGQTGLYYPDADISQLPGDEHYRQIPSYDKMGPGYPTGDPYYYGLQQSVAPHLARTASLGPSSRIRTRASTKQGLPKRSSLSEGGSTWSAMEPDESQNETDNFFNFPLSHSASFPFAFHPLQQFAFPEYQHMFRNFTQNQMFTFINHPPSVNNVGGTFESIENKDSNSPSVVISEEACDSTKTESGNKLSKGEEVTSSSVNEETLGKESETSKKEKESEREDDAIVKNENPEKLGHSNESLEVNEKSFNERSGRYNKKPAPTPPNEEPSSKATSLGVQDEAAEFFTPNSSPKLSRRHSSNTNLPVDKGGEEHENEKLHEGNLLEVPKKSKPKSKKLHMPKMNFSFWHSKTGKQASASETSSIASVEIASTNPENKNDLEYFIPLKGDEDSFYETVKQD